jgi:hypothetical protein
MVILLSLEYDLGGFQSANKIASWTIALEAKYLPIFEDKDASVKKPQDSMPPKSQ